MTKYDSKMLGKVWEMYEDNQFYIGGYVVAVLVVGLLLTIGLLGTI